MAAAKDQEEVTRGRKGHKKVTKKEGLKDQEEAKKNRTQEVAAKDHKEVTKKENLKDQKEAKKTGPQSWWRSTRRWRRRTKSHKKMRNKGRPRRPEGTGKLGHWAAGGCIR